MGNTNNRNKKCESVLGEFDTYIKEGLLKRSEIFDILGWWNHNGLKYPTLQCLARYILDIPVTTVASKSAFSTNGRLLSPHCSRLHMVLKTGPGREPEKGVVPVLVVRLGSDRWSNR